ncbi:MAG: sulfite exporter TauE/SafE family protein [Betaproteobacteria bacterium]
MAWSALIGAWLAGILGGVHCLTMCGGFVAAMSGGGGAPVPLRPATALAWRALPYNVGRIATYTALGALVGGVGGTALAGAGLLPVQRALFVVANLFLLALAVAIVRREQGFAWLQHAGAAVFARALPAVRPLATRDGVLARFALGLVWGLVPCGLTYSVLPVALFAGNAVAGAAVMLAFGMGTLPNLLAAGWAAARVRPWLARPAIRNAAAALLAAFAAVGIWRALWGPMSLAQGPFCLVP